MIVGSHEWSEVQPIDWRQITSLSLALFISLLFFSTCFELIWCRGDASRKQPPRAAIGCTLSSADTDVCLQKVGTNTQTHTICTSPKPAAPLPRLERLLTRNLDPMMDKWFPFLGTRNLDKLPQNSEVAKIYNARHHMCNDSGLSPSSESLHVWYISKLWTDFWRADNYLYFSAFWFLCPAISTHCFLDVHTVLFWDFFVFALFA